MYFSDWLSIFLLNILLFSSENDFRIGRFFVMKNLKEKDETYQNNLCIVLFIGNIDEANAKYVSILLTR